MNKLTIILQNIIYTTYLAELLPFILCLIFVKKIKSTELKVFFFYTATFAFFLLLSIYFRQIAKNFQEQLIVNRIFLIIEFTFLCFFYNSCLVNKCRKVVAVVAVSLFLLYSAYDFYISKPDEFTFIPLVIECLFFLLIIIFYFYEKIKYSIATPIYYSPDFWISVAFLIYFSGNFFLFLFSKSMYKNPNFKTEFTIIYGTITIIKNIFLCIAIFVNANSIQQQNKNNRPIDVDLGSFNPLTNKPNF